MDKKSDQPADSITSLPPVTQDISRQLERILWQDIGEPFVQFATMMETCSEISSAQRPLNGLQPAQDGKRSLLDFLPPDSFGSSDYYQHCMWPDAPDGTRSLAYIGHLKLNPSLEKYAPKTAFETFWERDKASTAQKEPYQRVADWLRDPRYNALHSKIMDILTPLDPIRENLAQLYRQVKALEKGLPIEQKAREKMLEELDDINVPPIPSFLRLQINNDGRKAIERIEKARIALRPASELVKRFDKPERWQRRHDRSHEQDRQFTDAGRAIAQLLIQRGEKTKTDAAKFAVDILCVYAPDYRGLNEEERLKITNRLRVSLYPKNSISR